MSLTVTPHSLSSNKTAALHHFATQGRLKAQIWGKLMAKTSADYTDAIFKKRKQQNPWAEQEHSSCTSLNHSLWSSLTMCTNNTGFY